MKANLSNAPAARPLWYLRAGGMPIASTNKKVPIDVIAWAHEGDSEWTPIGEERTRSEGGPSDGNG